MISVHADSGYVNPGPRRPQWRIRPDALRQL